MASIYETIITQNITRDYVNSLITHQRNEFNYTIGYYYNYLFKLINISHNYIINQIPIGQKGLTLISDTRKQEINEFFSDLIKNISQLKDEYLGINKQLEAIDSKKYEFRNAGHGNMQLYVDGIAEGEPIAEQEAISLSNTVTYNLQNGKWEAKKAGNYLVEGVQLGINEKKGSLFSNVTSLAQNVLNTLKKQWDINSPSKATKQFGQYLLQGLNLGIKDESKDSLKTISDFGNQVLSTFGSTVSNVSSEFDSMKLDNIITPQFTQEVTEKATTIRETRPIILNIDTFNNNTNKDIESLSNELAFYVRQKEVTG